MGSLERRLEALEELATPQNIQEWPDWDFQDQLEGIVYMLRDYQRFHPDGKVRYQATDREIHLMGLVCALWELPGGMGEHRYPSGVVVEWTEADDDGMQRVEAPGHVPLDDLPEEVRRHFERMDPAKQLEREHFLYENRHYAKKERERIRWHREHGWDQATPEHLRKHLRTREKAARGEGGR